MVIKKICENQELLEEADGETFLRKHPLHSHVRSSFRSVFNELTNEVREYPAVKWMKLSLSIQNILQVMQANFRSLAYRQPIATLS